MHEGAAQGRRETVDGRLDTLVPATSGPAARLTDAARYALLAPGKRLRPLLAMAAAEHWGGDPADALDGGCAVEMVHAASLILDDLPSMDDASLRRGRATVHRVYGEDLAVLAAVALLARAFGVMSACPAIAPAARLRLSAELAEAVGFEGLTGGQTRDLHQRDGAGVDDLALLNRQKTGVLFEVSAMVGALAAGADGQIERARRFGETLGAAFQIRDDLLDIEADTALTGKDAGQDRDKPTVVSLLGASGARARLLAELAAARAAAGEGPLRALTDWSFPEWSAAGGA